MAAPRTCEERRTERRIEEKATSKAGKNESLAEEREPKKIKDSVNNEDSFFFKSVLRDDGVLVKVGGAFIVNHLIDVVLLVTNIVGCKDGNFTVDLVSLKSEDGILKDVVKGFNLSLGIEHIVKEVNCKKSSKVVIFVNSLICDARRKLSVELGKNDSWYKRICRQFHLGTVIRMNVWSSLNKLMGSSAVVNLGTTDMLEDLSMFGLNDKNKYWVTHSISEFCKLDTIMGCKWDIRSHVQGDLSSFFQYVNNIVIYIDKSDILKVKFRYAQSSFPVCDNYREKCIDSEVARVHSLAIETASDATAALS